MRDQRCHNPQHGDRLKRRVHSYAGGPVLHVLHEVYDPRALRDEGPQRQVDVESSLRILGERAVAQVAGAEYRQESDKETVRHV